MHVKRAARAVWIGDSLASTEGGGWIAPHVAGEIVLLGSIGFSDVEQIPTGERRPRAGCPALGLRSPVGIAEQYTTALSAAGSAGRRLLLTAALSTTDRLDVLLAAAATDPAVLWRAGVEEILVWKGGRYAFSSPAARAAVLQSASEETAAVHRALTNAHRQRGEGGRSAWHAAHRGHAMTEGLAWELVQFGDRLLLAGSVDPAYRVGRLVAGGADGALGARGRLLMGRAAAAMGCFEEAAYSLESLRGGALDDIAAPVVSAVRDLLRGSAPGEDADATVVRQADLLRTIAVTRADGEAVAGVADVLGARGDDDEVDAIQSRLMVTAVGSVRSWPWTVVDGPLSPVVDAYLHVQQVGHLVAADDPGSAATVLREVLCRLPMTHLSGGAVAGLVRALRHVAPDLWDGFAGTLARVRPAVPVRLEMRHALTAPRVAAVASRLNREAGMRAARERAHLAGGRRSSASSGRG